MATDTTAFYITQATGFFHEVNSLLIALQGVAVVSELVVSGSVQHNPGDYVTIEARYLNARVRLPLVGPIQSAIANRLPYASLRFTRGMTDKRRARMLARLEE